jgi:hypothetical protein
MKGEEHQEVVLLQGVDKRSLGELQAHHDRPVLKALAQRACPGADVRRSVRYDGQFPLFAVASLWRRRFRGYALGIVDQKFSKYARFIEFPDG